ncbi:MAG: urease accessory protein UreE [Pseudomonadota bacterium]
MPLIRGTRISPETPSTVHSIALEYSARYRRRCVLECEDGLVFLLDLPRATELVGAVLLEDGRSVLIRPAQEALAEVRAGGQQLARLAWHIGNRHTPCQLEDGRLLIQRDHVLEEMLEGLGATVAHVVEPFRPEGGAYGYGRTHAHNHGHDPHADPNAHIAGHHD